MDARGSEFSRRGFLGAVGGIAASVGDVAAAATEKVGAEDARAAEQKNAEKALKPGISDGPPSSLFTPISLPGNSSLSALREADLSQTLQDRVRSVPQGNCVCWGIPFQVDRVALARKEPVVLRWPDVACAWLVCMHTSDMKPLDRDSHGFIRASSGWGRLNEHVADYVFLYADGSEERVAIRRRHQIGMLSRVWGENCFQAVAHQKPSPVRTTSEQPQERAQWGASQTRVRQPDAPAWVNWLWAWQNPHPEKALVGLRIEPKAGVVILSGITGGNVSSQPLRWQSRRKAVLRLSPEQVWDPELDSNGLLADLQLDLGQVISAQYRPLYPNETWADTYNNKPPQVSRQELLIEYTAHPEARFHLPGGKTVPVAELARGGSDPLKPVAPASRRVKLRVLDGNGRPVAVKLHIHGQAGEYLPPRDRHRIANRFWYEDWSVDYVNARAHDCSYIPGETVVDVPLGNVFVEVSKGFEIAPIRRIVAVDESTTELTFRIERLLAWRERGWVTADTHVHFLSPPSAHLEGAGEGVNVVNLLASQWGELMTNVGDFDGKTTFGSRETGGDGEYLVRVGTENRQHVLGHISLLGYNGSLIVPMTTAGPDESALGDPLDVLLTEWARQCHRQGGIVVGPHFPNPRAELAAAIVTGDIDAVEMTSWGNLYGGIDPYSLSDWYRYLNCGHFVAAVGGTDKMSADTAVGTVRTYARLAKDRPFDFAAWMDAIRSGHTFVSYGPLLEFSVMGNPPGARLELGAGGGTLAIEWQVASVTVPMSRVELVVNGEIRESQKVDSREDRGHWSLKVNKSSWVALLVRGHYADKPEIIAAHSSPVMVSVKDTPFFAAADALTILEQIEGALAYVDTIGTRAETAVYQRIRMMLVSAHRSLHNRLHNQGVFHQHTPATDHTEHHGE